MIFKTGCKINLGLRIISKRDDGYHDISTVFYPINSIWDLIEIVPSEIDGFSSSGIAVDCPDEKNLCIIARNMLRTIRNVPPCRIHLHKTIPFGAGLGAGSANAMGVIEGLDRLFSLGLTLQEKMAIGLKVGSDVPFFACHAPRLATGRGEILSEIEVDLSGKYIIIAKPEGSVSTKEAYTGTTPDSNATDTGDIVESPIESWRERLLNDFENTVFTHIPQSAELKKAFYDNGALYASMSGSGSAVYGIFSEKPDFVDSRIIHAAYL